MSEQILPQVQETTLADRNLLIDSTGLVQGQDVVLDSTNVDVPTPTFRIRPGNVVVLRTSTGLYVEATDPNGDRNTVATITSVGHVDGNGVIAVVYKGMTISVTTATGSGTEAENATDLNADVLFRAHLIASSGAGELTIASRSTGADEDLFVDATTRDAAGFAEGIANSVNGVDEDYKVTADFGDLQDDDGNAVNGAVATWDAAHFDESNLLNLTGEARGVFARRGSRFS